MLKAALTVIFPHNANEAGLKNKPLEEKKNKLSGSEKKYYIYDIKFKAWVVHEIETQM